VQTRLEEQVLLMRREGRSFGAIAKALGLDRAREAHEAFLRALRRLPRHEQDAVRTEELERLDRLARRLREDSVDDADVERKLRVVDRLRRAVQG
jgi:hypothetical protein